MNKSSIEWLAHPSLGPGMTWNPLAMRCTPVSRGCDHCWHLRFAARHAKNPAFEQAVRDAYAGGAPVLREEELAAPLRRRKPTMIAVQLMGDLFHEQVSDEVIAAVFGVMAACPQHLFVVLTKRTERLPRWSAMAEPVRRTIHWVGKSSLPGLGTGPWPLPNVILGTSIEDQPSADARLPDLLRCPAARRVVSVEPMLGPVDLWAMSDGSWYDWVIFGGEAGLGARPMHPEWARDLRNQCVAAGVPFMFKQWGDWVPDGNLPACTIPDGRHFDHHMSDVPGRHDEFLVYHRVGKKLAGRDLDGRTWEQFPSEVL